jgi:hypothetical protein
MKLRLQNSSLRLRLNEREVDNLGRGEKLVNETFFPESKLTILLASGTVDKVNYHDDLIEVIVDFKKIEAWAKSDEVTIAMEFAVSNDKKLSILVEKDIKV